MSYDIIVLTDHRYLKDSDDPYKHNVFYEDKLVVDALRKQNLLVDRKAWDDSSFDWSITKSTLFRTTWDYFERFDEFSKWLGHVSKQTHLFNSEKLIRWNLDKHYLKDLAKKNINVPKTEYIEASAKITLKELHSKLQWSETVLKPCVSGAGRHTYRLNKNNLAQYESIFKTLLKNEAMMLQPFQRNIVAQGEISLMIINGQYTHAILKKAKAGDFRVQDDFGGSVHDYKPDKAEIQFAIDTVKACDEIPLYARVDIFKDNSGHIALAELELIEPELWFRNHPNAAMILAEAIKEKLSLS